jgi:hypothetical protein
MKKIMAFILSLCFLGSVASADAARASRRQRCSTKKLDVIDVLLVESQLARYRLSRGYGAGGASGGGGSSDQATKNDEEIIVPVYFHVLNTGSRADQGNVPNRTFERQIDILNKAYKPAKMTFTLAGIDRTTNATWMAAAIGSDDDHTTRENLHQGGYETLNVYTITPSSGDLGWAQMPWDVVDYPLLDGISIDYRSLPGGEFAEYNQGLTLVHEVGHWVGLYHTFDFGCDTESGDYVLDTPAEATASFGCPATAPDTCPNDPGLDPIHNYMDYSDDVCMNEFTPEQIQRMRDTYFVYRSGK